MDVWAACRDRLRPAPIEGRFTRIVESQAQVATTALVRDLAEQSLLEELLEAAKPPLRAGTEGLHYLLATPFRYPPLRHGSRFGSRFEPSLLYGSLTLRAALAETAYYRFVFWQGMAEPPPSGRLLTQHTGFSAAYATGRGLRLQAPPFDAHEARLRDPERYDATQALGAALRAHGIEAFEYRSARDREDGLNVALFVPEALASREPTFEQPWLCETRTSSVDFSAPGGQDHRRFPLEDFLIDGRLPHPAI
jgi:hypothetical protein